MRRREFIAALGGTAVWPVVARAQQPTMPAVGFMSGRSLADSHHLVTAFREGLTEAGFTEGINVTIVFRWADGQPERLSGLAAELVARPVAVLVGVGGDLSARAAKRATSTIPVIFGMGDDPVKAGLVDSFNRPGGNATGYTLWTNRLESKRFGLLHELTPGVALVGILLNPQFPSAPTQLQEIEGAARALNQKILVMKASSDDELTTAFDGFLQQQIGALHVAADPFFDTRHRRIIAFAAQNRIPAIYQFREYAVSGGLISYGPRITDLYAQAGRYAGRILRGTSPSDLPIVQPTRFEMVVNLNTAKALGLAVPNSIQLLADEVIE
jgi:putative ABC transport system substrate-binding protein